MTESIVAGLAGVVVIGIVAQWLAWRLHLPSILLLLLFGFIAGPVAGLIDPDALFGDLLFPIVSLSVAIILFEGGLNLKIEDLRAVGGTVRNLVSVGALVNWMVAAAAAFTICGFSFELSLLTGAILIVSGPTVILPILRHIRPKSEIASILRWEGIVIDPVGATMALITFQMILTDHAGEATALLFKILFQTIMLGGLTGLAAAGCLIFLLKRYLIPDFLHNAVTLSFVFFAFVAANHMQSESGLLTVTVMGIVLANQKKVAIRHIMEFKENLGTLAVSGLFILLAARLRFHDFALLGWSGIAFLAALIIIARPLSVIFSTIGSPLSWKGRLFLAGMAPRGIVAAAVSSVFALRLADSGIPQAENLVPLVFIVIIGTVIIYGLSAGPLAEYLKIAYSNSRGFLIIGAYPFALDIGVMLKNEGYAVIFVETNRANIMAARRRGLVAYYGNVLSESFLEEIELAEIDRVLAMTPNDEVNALALLHSSAYFNYAERYQLCADSSGRGGVTEAIPKDLQGRLLFEKSVTFDRLQKLFGEGAVLKKTALTEKYTYRNYQNMYGRRALPLFLIEPDRTVTVFTSEHNPQPQPGQELISLVVPE